jgi:hypothetical protein
VAIFGQQPYPHSSSIELRMEMTKIQSLWLARLFSFNCNLRNITPKSARSLKWRAFLLRKKRDALNGALDFFVMFFL